MKTIVQKERMKEWIKLREKNMNYNRIIDEI